MWSKRRARVVPGPSLCRFYILSSPSLLGVSPLEISPRFFPPYADNFVCLVVDRALASCPLIPRHSDPPYYHHTFMGPLSCLDLGDETLMFSFCNDRGILLFTPLSTCSARSCGSPLYGSARPLSLPILRRHSLPLSHSTADAVYPFSPDVQPLSAGEVLLPTSLVHHVSS